jgi:cytochrome c553
MMPLRSFITATVPRGGGGGTGASRVAAPEAARIGFSMHARSFPLLALGLPLLACGGGDAPPPEAPAPLEETVTVGEEAPAPAPAGLPADQVMRGHFNDVAQARNALIRGEVSAAVPPLQRIADARYGLDMPSDWGRWVAEMQRTAAQGARLSSIRPMARQVARLGRECGECHEDTGGGPDVDAASPPLADDADPVAAQMQRHAWGVEQLWLGLTAPSYPAWARGAAALQAEAAEGSHTEAFATARSLGERAAEARTTEEREELYAELLGRCAACHSGS